MDKPTVALRLRGLPSPAVTMQVVEARVNPGVNVQLQLTGRLENPFEVPIGATPELVGPNGAAVRISRIRPMFMDRFDTLRVTATLSERGYARLGL